MKYVLGLDLGTSSLKGILMNEEGKVICEKTSEYTLDIPHPGYSEQRPEYWIVACEDVLTKISIEIKDFGNNLEGISFSGQMHSLVILDKKNTPIYPAILWNDVRTTEQCKEITEKLGNELIDITKNIALEGFTLPKILWLQKNEPNIWSQVHSIMMPKDYLGYWFTGNVHTEYSDAAGTLLLDLEKKQWSKKIMTEFSIEEYQLPNLVPSMSMIGTVRKEICERFKINEQVKVFAGGADNACAALGAGIIDEDTGLVSIGTSGVFSAFEPSCKNYKGKLHLFNHVLPNMYYSMGVTLAAGNSLNWYKNTFGKGKSFEELLMDIYTVAPGSDGLLFTPYIVGERTPHFDSKIRGSFIGIDTHHEMKHFSRSVMEGITFSLKDSQEIMATEKGNKFKRLISVGGGATNSDWMQMQADIFDAEIIRLEVEQGPGAGACMIAAYGCNWVDTTNDLVDTFVSYKKAIFYPKKENVEKYTKVYSAWKEIYSATKNICYVNTNIYN